jgi:hypothetical protein
MKAVEQACYRLTGPVDADRITLSELCKCGLSADLVREGKYPLKKLLWRPWFQRVWVIQEAAVATKVALRCGHDCVS